jgi:Family of unknown function (DUF5906)
MAMSDLVLETVDGNEPVEKIIQKIRDLGLKATLFWTDQKRRVVIPLDGEIDEKQYVRLVQNMQHEFKVYFDPAAKDPTELPSGQSRTFESTLPKPVSADDLESASTRSNAGDEDKGPEVPIGIDLMGARIEEEIGDVRARAAPGFIADYQIGLGTRLEQLAGVVGQVVVQQNDGFWVRSENGWNPTTRSAARGLVKSEWRKVLAQHGVRCKHSHIEDLFRGSLLPVVDGTLTSPVRVDFVEYQGRSYLNLRLAPRLDPTPLGEDGRLIRDFFCRVVLNDQRGAAQIEAELADKSASTSTRWALNWFAHLYQRPGIAMGAGLWLISVQQGVGKSLVGRMMAELVGRRNAVWADQSEMAEEWSDWMLGHSLILADEINVTEKKSFYAKQKSWIASRTISIRRRGVGSWEIPSIVNWLFTTNDLQPIRIDGADRRNMMIETTNDLGLAKSIIAKLAPILDNPARFRSALAEFGGWLDQIEIDDNLIAEAISTSVKEDLIESTRDPVESFIHDQFEHAAWKREQWLPTDDLMQRFFAWCDRTNAFTGYKSLTHLVNGLKRARARGWVDQRRTSKGRGWVLTNPPFVEETVKSEALGEIVVLPRGMTAYERVRQRKALAALRSSDSYPLTNSN